MQSQRSENAGWNPSSVLRSSIFLGLEFVLRFLLGLATSVLLLRLLQTDDLGYLKTIEALAPLSIYFFSFGLSRIIMTAAPKLIAAGNGKGAVRLHLTLATLRACACLVFALVVWSQRPRLLLFMDASDFPLALFIVAILNINISNLHEYVSKAWLIATMRRDLVSLGVIVRRLGLLAWVVGMLAVKVATLEAVLWGVFMSLLLEVAWLGWSSIWVMRKLRIQDSGTTSLEGWRYGRFGVSAWLWEMLQYCRDPAASTILVATMMGPHAVALQHAARLLPIAIRHVGPASGGAGILLPKLSARIALGHDPQSLRFTFLLLTKLNFVVLGGCLALLLTNIGFLLPALFGPDYQASVVPALLFGLSSFLTILCDPYYLSALAAESGRVLLGAGIIALLSFLAAAALIPTLGISGVALANVAGGLVLLIFFSSTLGTQGLRFPTALAVSCSGRLLVIPAVSFLASMAFTAIGLSPGVAVRFFAAVFAVGAYVATFYIEHPFSDDEAALLRARIVAPMRAFAARQRRSP